MHGRQASTETKAINNSAGGGNWNKKIYSMIHCSFSTNIYIVVVDMFENKLEKTNKLTNAAIIIVPKIRLPQYALFFIV